LGHDSPLAVTAMGGKFAVTDNREVPDTLEVIWQYPGNTLVTFTQINTNGAGSTARPGEIEFRGTKGTLYVQWNGYEIVPEMLTPNEFPVRSPLTRDKDRLYRKGSKAEIKPKKASGKDATDLHARNFLDCVKTRRTCNCDIETGHRSTTASLIGNVAHKTHSLLRWDARAERFIENDEANKYLSYRYRPPYKLPS
jgi:hypothetical protein